jgi:tetratricopeptide (TPR) repeat protein
MSDRAASSEASLIGRTGELELLENVIGRVEAGASAFVLLEGEAGIGKSRLLSEAMHRVKDRGFQVYAGEAEVLERYRPFGPLTDALRCHKSSSAPEAALIARLLRPDFSVGEQEITAGPVLQFRVVELFVELAQKLAAAAPVALLVEDLHWADSSTVLAIRALTKRLSHQPLLVLVSLRPTPRTEELDALVRRSVEEGAVLILLKPLGDEGVAHLAAELLGAPPGPQLRELLTGAGGNPLFVTELVRSLSEDRALELKDGSAETANKMLPPTLRLTILRRLASIGSRSVDVLRLASVFGTRFSVLDLAGVSNRSSLDLVPEISDAVRAGLLVESGRDLTFRHDLVREAIYQDLPVPVRRGLHRDIARTLISTGGSADRIATHLARAAWGRDAEASAWLQRAARQAASRAPAEAVDFLRQALDLLEPVDSRRDALFAELVQITMWAGRVAEAAAMARSALDGPHSSSVEGSLRLSLARALMITGRAEEAVEVCEAPVEGLAPSEAVQLRADASLAKMVSGDLYGAERTAEEALAMPPSNPDDAVIATSALANVAMYRGELDRALGLGKDVVDTIRTTTDPVLPHYPAHYFHSVCLVTADRMDEADSVLAEGRILSEQRGNIWNLPQLHWVAAVRGFLVGSWDDAVTEAETGLDMAADAGTRQGARFAHSVLALVALHRGETEKAIENLGRAENEPFFSTWGGWPGLTRALVHEALGEPEKALEVLEETWGRSVLMGIVSDYPLWGPDLVRLLVGAQSWERAREVCGALESAAERISVAYAQGAALLVRGLG